MIEDVATQATRIPEWTGIGLGGMALLALIRFVGKFSVFLDRIEKGHAQITRTLDAHNKHLERQVEEARLAKVHREAQRRHWDEMERHAMRLEQAIRIVGVPTRLPDDPTPIENVRVAARNSEASGA